MRLSLYREAHRHELADGERVGAVGVRLDDVAGLGIEELAPDGEVLGDNVLRRLDGNAGDRPGVAEGDAARVAQDGAVGSDAGPREVLREVEGGLVATGVNWYL